jgi:hypothetical protein
VWLKVRAWRVSLPPTHTHTHTNNTHTHTPTPPNAPQAILTATAKPQNITDAGLAAALASRGTTVVPIEEPYCRAAAANGTLGGGGAAAAAAAAAAVVGGGNPAVQALQVGCCARVCVCVFVVCVFVVCVCVSAATPVCVCV